MRYILAFSLALGITVGASAQSVALVDQNGNGNAGDITQSGANQFGKIEQGSVFASNDNEAEILQSGGTDNDAYVRQNGNLNDGVITQIGNRNDALSETSPGLSIAGNENHTDIYQQGNENYARIGVNGNENGDVDGNAIEVEQIGFRNRGQLFFTGSNNQGFVDQSSGDDYNYVYFSAGGANGFAGRPVITADDNTVEFTQSGGAKANGFLAGDGNQVYVHQSGANFVGIESETAYDGINVYGNDNLVEIDQTMSGNMARVSIDGATPGTLGNMNTVDIDQHGVDGTATVNIDGSNNHSTISQN